MHYLKLFLSYYFIFFPFQSPIDLDFLFIYYTIRTMQYNLRYLFEISNLCSWILRHIHYKFICLYISFIYIRHSLCNPRPIQFIDFLYVIYQRIPYSSCKWLTLAKMLFIFCTLKNCECRISSRFEKLNFLCIIFFPLPAKI